MNISIKDLKKDGLLLRNIAKREQTRELCMAAIKANPQAIKYASKKNLDKRLCFDVIKKDPSLFKYIPQQYITEKIAWVAIEFDGMFLKDIPNEFKSKELCLFAIKKNPELIDDVSWGIKRTILEENKSVDFIKSIIRYYPEALRYMPIDHKGVNTSLELIKENLSLSKYLPLEIKKDKDILEYQKLLGKIKYIDKMYLRQKKVFNITVIVVYDIVPGVTNSEENVEKYYKLDVDFNKFDDFYRFLDGDLNNSNLLGYSFEGIRLNEYNINGAAIRSEILKKYGLYDGSFFEGFKKHIEYIGLLDVESNNSIIESEDIYLKALEDSENLFDYSKRTFYYISDIHLCHRVSNFFVNEATKEEIREYIKILVYKMVVSVGEIPKNSYLLIAGDTASRFEFLRIFYDVLITVWIPENIIVISGNHELWDPPIDYNENIDIYRDYYNKIGINYLQNDVLFIGIDGKKVFMNGDNIDQLGNEEIRDLANKCSIMVLGGIGFSGFNKEYNAVNMRYGKSFEMIKSEDALKLDRYETDKFNKIYKKLLNAIPLNKVIVLTHMKKYDWNEEVHNPNWIYLNGHDHRNIFELSNEKVIYADNQIGYKKSSLGLKYFYINNYYDIFLYLNDGIHKITKNQYLNFNRGKRICIEFKRSEGQIYMIKKNGVYMFFIYCFYNKNSVNKKLYFLNGGRLQNLDYERIEDLEYLYGVIDRYSINVNKFLEKYSHVQKTISKFIREIGGSGKIHGCIVDIDKAEGISGYSYCHLYINPVDGIITPYYADDIGSRLIYKDLKTLLQNQPCCKELKKIYLEKEKEINSKLPVLQKNSGIDNEFKGTKVIRDYSNYMYKVSNKIVSLQYVTEKGIIRIWNEDLLDLNFIKVIE